MCLNLNKILVLFVHLAVSFPSCSDTRAGDSWLTTGPFLSFLSTAEIWWTVKEHTLSGAHVSIHMCPRPDTEVQIIHNDLLPVSFGGMSCYREPVGPAFTLLCYTSSQFHFWNHSVFSKTMQWDCIVPLLIPQCKKGNTSIMMGLLCGSIAASLCEKGSRDWLSS